MRKSATTPHIAEENGSIQQHLITAGFFVVGLHEVRTVQEDGSAYALLIKTWGQGYLELIDSLLAYVPYTLEIADAAARVCDKNYPGVFDYEVSSAFGKWFGQYVLEHGEEPSTKSAQDWLMNETITFFCQGLSVAECRTVETSIHNTLPSA